MNARIVVFVGCRLLALYLLLNYGVVTFVNLIRAAMFVVAGHALLIVEVDAISLILFLGASAVFWLRAGWISDHAVGPLKDIQCTESEIDDWRAVGLAAVGGLFLLTSAKFVDGGMMQLARDSHSFEKEAFTMQVGFALLLGILFLMFGRSVVTGLKALREWGGKPFFPKDVE